MKDMNERNIMCAVIRENLPELGLHRRNITYKYFIGGYRKKKNYIGWYRFQLNKYLFQIQKNLGL